LHQVPVDLEPKKAKAEDRLGLESQVSPVKRISPSQPPLVLPPERQYSAPFHKKPILKYRSLSDILTVPHSRHLRLGEEDGLESPEDPTSRSISSFNATSSDRTLSPMSEDVSELETFSAADDSLELEHGQNGRRRHIAFSNRVEQCIAVDSDEDRIRYVPRPVRPSSRARPRRHSGSAFQASSDDDDEEGGATSSEEEALTFKTSRSPPTSAAYGGYALHRSNSAGSSKSRTGPESPLDGTLPFTIAKLAPTILKNSELLPSPSPAVVFTSESQRRPHPDLVGFSDDSEDTDGISNRFIETVAVPAETAALPASVIIDPPMALHGTAPAGERTAASPPNSPTALKDHAKAGIIATPRSILKTVSPALGSPSLLQEPEERGRSLSRTSSSSSLDGRSASRTASASSSIGRSSAANSDDESGKERGEDSTRPDLHLSNGALEDMYLDDVDLEAWKQDSSEGWAYVYGEARINPGLITVVGEAIGTTYDAVRSCTVGPLVLTLSAGRRRLRVWPLATFRKASCEDPLTLAQY
jgi:hypothetical protein